MAFLLLICWPIAEILVAIEVARAIGILPTLLLLIAGFPLGAWALHSRGRAAWRRLGDAVSARRPPGREVLDGALIVIGGVLLMVPGFITDALGVLLLLAPMRTLTRGLLARNLQSRLIVTATRGGRPRRSDDVDSTARDIDGPRLPR
jgi:UPF0716 protein FxsA